MTTKHDRNLPEITLVLACLALQFILRQAPLTVVRYIVNGAFFIFFTLSVSVDLVTRKTIKR